MQHSAIVQKLWNYCNVLRDDGMSYGDWPALLMNASAASADPLLRHAFVRRARRSALRRTARVRLRASPLHAPVSRRGLALSPRTAMSIAGSIEQLTYLLFLKMADERTKPPYNQPSQIPDKYSWPSLLKRDGDDLFDHYRHLLEEFGKKKGYAASSLSYVPLLAAESVSPYGVRS